MATKRKTKSLIPNPDDDQVPPAVSETTKNPAPPKCRVIRRKVPGQPGMACENDATCVINVTDPVDGYSIAASMLLCDEHAKAFEGGKSLVVESKSGQPLLVKAG